ncbi:MAG: hypothetical protein JEZ06_11185 [Anaerolineaceae bacterium]|nr:hypothetical protein [Anaerolineaceae bacterium]
MYRIKSLHLAALFLLTPVFLVSCSGSGSQENVPLNPVQEVALDSILPNAITACDDAYSAPIRGGSIDQVAIVLFNKEYNADSSWELADYPHFARTPDELGSLICIKETRIDEDTYSDGKTAYRRDWIVRVLSWPDGTVISENTFTGGAPVEVKTHSNDDYGHTPYENFMRWAGEMSAGRFMFVEELVDFSLVPGENSIAYAAFSHTGIWSPDENLTSILSEHGGVTSIAYSPDGTIIAVGYNHFVGGILNIIDAESREGLGQLMPLKIDDVTNLAFSPGGEFIAGGLGSFVSLWAPPNQLAVNELNHPNGHIKDLAFSPDGSLIAAAAGQSKIVVWGVESGEEVTTIDKLPDSALAVEFSPDIEKLAIGGEGFLSLWDPVSGKKKSTIYENESGRPDVSNLVFSTDGGKLAASFYLTIRLWDLTTTREELPPLAGHTKEITRSEFSSTGMLVSSAKDNTIRIWALP